jgi:TonB family protein
MKMTQEAVEISTAPLDDSLFGVPADCTVEPFADLMNGITAAAVQSMKTPAAKAPKTTPAPSIPDNVKAYVPSLAPVSETEPVYPEEARASHAQGAVQVLVTVGPKGSVERAEALSGPEALRKAAIDTVGHWTYRPVIRNGAPVTAYTDAQVYFFDRSNAAAPPPGFQFTADMAAAGDRLAQLEEVFPRSPEQEFADLEQDAAGDAKSRRFDLLDGLAVKAMHLGFNDKAKAYTNELLAAAEQHPKSWNYGNAIHDGHMVLGLLALRSDDVPTACEELLKSGKTPGSPQLNSFGQRDTVLDYFELCRKFWKMGGQQLDSWSETVRKGQTPAFGASLR